MIKSEENCESLIVILGFIPKNLRPAGATMQKLPSLHIPALGNGALMEYALPSQTSITVVRDSAFGSEGFFTRKNTRHYEA